MNKRPWDVFHRHFPTLKPPLAVAPEVAAVVDEAIAAHRMHALLLGVTPLLADLAANTTAVDWNEAMITRVWPGDTKTRRAITADWRAMPVPAAEFTAVIGDGSFNCLNYASDYAIVFTELARVLKPGARFAVRFFTTPSPGETLDAIRADAIAGRIRAIDALKWRLGMAMAARDGANVARGTIFDAFEAIFDDRNALMGATGWTEQDLAAVDWYKGAPDIISFPTTDEILTAVPASFINRHFVSSGNYELAERCPTLVMDFRP